MFVLVQCVLRCLNDFFLKRKQKCISLFYVLYSASSQYSVSCALGKTGNAREADLGIFRT